ncbi:MAG: MFS transporter [Gemmatimonadota bacterium]
MTTAVRSLNPFRVLQSHRNFRLFWIGQTLSLVGSWMQTMAIGWLTLQLSDSAFVVGLVASIGALPIVVLSMHAGAFVDVSDRLRLVRATQSIMLVEALVLWILTWTGHISIPVLLVLALVQGVCSAVEIPARQSFIIQLVGRDDLQPAIALNSSGFNLARIVGPALGGLVIARFGIAWCFGFNAVSFIAVLWGLMLIRLPSPELGESSGTLREFLARSTQGAADGLRHLMQPGLVRDLLAMVSVGALFGHPFLTVMPVMARDRLGTDAGGYGGLLASVGVGGLVGALTIAGPAADWPRGKLLLVTGIAFPALLVLFSQTTNLTTAHTLLFLIGVVLIAFSALSNSMLQLLTPDAFRGRLMAFYSLVYVGLSQAVGSLAIGALSKWVGVDTAIAVFAAITLGYAALTFVRSPHLIEL